MANVDSNLGAISTALAALKVAGDVVNTTDAVTVRCGNNGAANASVAYQRQGTTAPGCAIGGPPAPSGGKTEIARAVDEITADPGAYRMSSSRDTAFWFFFEDCGDHWRVVATLKK